MGSEPTSSDAEGREDAGQAQPASETEAADAASATKSDASENGAGDASSARRVLTTGAAAGAVAAAVGAAVVTARRAMSSRETSGGGESGGGSGEESSGPDVTAKAKEVVDKTRKRGESLSPTLKAAGREIFKQNLIPVAETAAATAGAFAATSAPDIVRERLVPKFIASFNEAVRDK